MYKKGFVQTKVMQLLLIATVVIVFLAFFQQVSNVVYDTGTSEKCRASVERNARYNVAGLDLGTQVDCPTKKLVLKGENMEEVKEQLANAMYTCWRQFDQGQLRLFAGEGVFCNVCYIVDVKTSAPITGFGNYLKETPSPTENLYYYDYLSSFKTSKAPDILSGTSPDNIRLDNTILSNIDGENKYAIMFIYARGEKYMEKMLLQITMQSPQGKAVTPIALGTGVLTGIGVGTGTASALGIATTIGLIGGAPITVPIAIGVVAGVGTFLAIEHVASLFSKDTPPQWLAFNVLREWNAEDTPKELKELGCRIFVETESI